jgi:hypothetical protein
MLASSIAVLVGVSAFLAGSGLGILLTYLLTVRQLISSLNEMRFRGWAVEHPLPERPKTLPMPQEEESDY